MKKQELYLLLSSDGECVTVNKVKGMTTDLFRKVQVFVPAVRFELLAQGRSRSFGDITRVIENEIRATQQVNTVPAVPAESDD